MASNKPALNKPSLFDQTENLPELDAQEAARQAYKERSRADLAKLDEQAEVRLTDINNLIIGGMRFTETGLVEVNEITEDGLILIGNVLHRFKGSFQWLMGDWLNRAEVYTWAQMETVGAHFHLKVQTLKNWKSVSANVPQYLRKYRLEFGHFALVAYLPEDQQQHWLERAEHGEEIPDKPGQRARWSVARLRKAIGMAAVEKAYTPPLLDKSYRRTFGKLWRNAERGTWEKITSKDISALKGWLIILEEETATQLNSASKKEKK